MRPNPEKFASYEEFYAYALSLRGLPKKDIVDRLDRDGAMIIDLAPRPLTSSEITGHMIRRARLADLATAINDETDMNIESPSDRATRMRGQ
jgi:hypothetical protein